MQGLPWKVAISLESTLPQRASLHPDNAKKFHHGKGYGIGHQWTTMVVILNGVLIPLRPLPSYSERYCREHTLAYQTEHERVVEYRNTLMLEDSSGAYDPRDVIVFAESGYEEKKIEHAIVNTRWHCIRALGKTRRVTSETLDLTTSTSRQWCHMATFFRHHRRRPWTTIRLLTSGTKRQRMACRIRHTMGSLRSVGTVHVVCAALRKRPDGRRKSLACHDGKATARQIMLGYRLRGAVELFHQDVKRPLGFEEVATSGFDSVQSHVHWVYCAYIFLRMSPPGVPPEVKAVGDKQRHIQKFLVNKGKRHVLQKLSHIGGVERYKDELRQALAAT